MPSFLIMIIVYSCSKLYEKYAQISIESVLRHNPDADIKIVCKEKLDLPYEQITVNQDKKVLDGKIHPSWEGSAKLFFEQLPYDKIIYLGADTICLGSLQEMWDIPCEYINACKSHNYGKIQAQQLGIPYYINVDSMVMNLDALRKDNFKEKAFAVMDKIYNMVDLWCNEESMINYAFHNKIKLLPQRFNVAVDRAYDEDIKDPVILHFIGPNKGKMYESNYINLCTR